MRIRVGLVAQRKPPDQHAKALVVVAPATAEELISFGDEVIQMREVKHNFASAV